VQSEEMRTVMPAAVFNHCNGLSENDAISLDANQGEPDYIRAVRPCWLQGEAGEGSDSVCLVTLDT
jgi:hypothetical protein